MSTFILKGGDILYEKYAKRRDELGLTDYRVSKDTGVPYSCISDWKKGRCTPKIDKIKKIAKYLKVSVSKLTD